MSRELPERPSFDHLRRQAKVLLRALRLRDPQAKLSTAQHTLAREYGFASWRDLKTHVQRLSANEPDVPIADYEFGRYTSRARLALFFSRDEASKGGSTSIDPEHILLGSIRAEQGSRIKVFERAHVSLDAARTAATSRSGGTRIPYSVEIPFSGATRTILLAATTEADRLGHETIGIGHLLLALLGRESRASALLTRWGITSERVRDGIADLLDEESA
ncbi:MAG TPA: Clp protease N-terminal domain-containing protein [Vicinamibacterales bacterium]|nr:Clp protease N-terminal domain-containing protein [Vicinamibacterales bacterium]